LHFIGEGPGIPLLTSAPAFASQLHYVIIASIDIEIDFVKKKKEKKGKDNNMRLI